MMVAGLKSIWEMSDLSEPPSTRCLVRGALPACAMGNPADASCTTCEGREMRPNHLRRTARIAAWGLMLVLGAGQAQAQGKTVVLAMPACPLSMTTIPETITEFTLPSANPLGVDLSVTGTLQTTDQTSSTLTLTQVDFEAGLSGLQFSRTLKQVGHLTGQVTFDKGCTKTDPYGSNDCTCEWGETIA